MITLNMAIAVTFMFAFRYFAHKMGGGGGGGGGRPGGGSGARKFFLWAGVVFSSLAGVFATDTFIGDMSNALAGAGVLLGWPVIIVLFLGILKDLWGDREPDGIAPYCFFLLPSWCDGYGGWFGSALNSIFDAINEVGANFISSAFS